MGQNPSQGRAYHLVLLSKPKLKKKIENTNYMTTFFKHNFEVDIVENNLIFLDNMVIE